MQTAVNFPGPIFTIGHSTRPFETFLAMLEANKITMLVDVRTIPRSRHNPQYNRDTLPGELERAGIRYLHMPGLGGLRHARPDSVNLAWRNASFRGFADYMQTDQFAEGLNQLLEIAQTETVAIMCAEAVPWRCHRSLIADALFARGVKTIHIMSPQSCQEHKLTSIATVKGANVVYTKEGSDWRLL